MAFIKGIFWGLIALIVSVLIYLIVIIFFPVLSAPKQPIPTQKKRDNERQKAPTSRQDVAFSVAGQTISAWLYLPDNIAKPVPCVVMNHGFGGTKDFLLESYALHFVAAGFAVLTYDYRHFGASEGEPRQLFDMSQQIEDLDAGIAYARSRREIDPERIVLWGTSAGGGHGLIVAAKDDKIAGVIAQCAGLDAEADSKLFMEREGWGYFLRLFVHAQRDKGRSRFGFSPHTFSIVGKPGTFAMITAPGAFEGYSKLAKESATFKNEVCARLLFMGHSIDANEAAKEVRCPVLFLVCTHDNLVAPTSHVKAANALGAKATVKSFPIGHFDIYEGDHFETAVHEMMAFLQNIT